jgi:hypothetical protein
VDAGSTLIHGLIVANSLNNRQAYPADVDPQLGVASYHSGMDITENTFVGFENRGYVLAANDWDKSSGTFGTDDYYLRPVDLGYWRNAGNRLINSDPGYRALPPHLQGNFTVEGRNFWTLAGALWDPHGLWGDPGRYWILDAPFLRDNTCKALMSRVPAGRPNGMSCAGPYYGVMGFWLNRGLVGATDRYVFHERMEVTRQDLAGQPLGRWDIEAGHNSRFLGHMRHFAALKGDEYIVRFPRFPENSVDKSAPRWVQFQVEGLKHNTDGLVVGMHFDGRLPARRVLASTNPDYPNLEGTGANSRLLLPAASKAEVLAGAGGLFWQDTANDLVWIKATPLGLAAPWAGIKPGSDEDLYRTYNIRIEP